MVLRSLLIVIFSALVSACSHGIVITPTDSTAQETAPLSNKKVAYVMSEEDRNKQVTTGGGGGDKVNYYPYRDLEKMIRLSLKSVYTDVSVIKSATDQNAIQNNSVMLVFTPEISTSSSSDSMLTWPPTQFSIVLHCEITDSSGKKIKRISVVGDGKAEYPEFVPDFGLAGKRAAADVGKKLQKALQEDTSLH